MMLVIAIIGTLVISLKFALLWITWSSQHKWAMRCTGACAIIILVALWAVCLSGCSFPGIDNHGHNADNPGPEAPQRTNTIYPTPLAEKVAKRDGKNYLGCYMGMIAEWDGQGVMMFSATSGELLKWISYDDFKAIFVDKTKPEYP